MQWRPFSREFTFRGQDRSLHNEPRHSGGLTPDMNSAFPLRLHLQKVYIFLIPTPQNQRTVDTSLSCLHSPKDLIVPQPSYARCRQPPVGHAPVAAAFSVGGGHPAAQALSCPSMSWLPLLVPWVLWTILWDEWQGLNLEKKGETNWLRVGLKLKVH